MDIAHTLAVHMADEIADRGTGLNETLTDTCDLGAIADARAMALDETTSEISIRLADGRTMFVAITVTVQR